MSVTRETTVLLFKDLNKTLKAIPDTDAGILMKAIFAHVNGEEPEGLERSDLARALFIGISDQVDRLEEYRNKQASKRNKQEQTGTKTEQNGSPYPIPYPIPDPTPTPTPTPDPIPSSSKDSEGEEKRELKLPKRAALPDVLDQDFVQEAFRDFREMRSKMKKPMTARAEELIIKDLAKLAKGDAVAAVKIIEQSIKNGWQGLFPLKERADGQNINERLKAL